MNTNHTPTPWKLAYDPRWIWANVKTHDGMPPDIGKGLSPEDAAHIVACVNARDALTARVAELEAALHAICEKSPTETAWYAVIARDAINSRAALAKS